jgi:hypothetical protein
VCIKIIFGGSRSTRKGSQKLLKSGMTSDLWRELNLLVVVVVVSPSKVSVVGHVSREAELVERGLRGALQQLVERVEVVVARLLRNHARLLQKVVVDVSAHRVALKEQVNNVTKRMF